MGALDVAQLYQSWAEANRAPSLTLKAIKRAMVEIGHRHFHSNGMIYADVQLASELPTVADTFPDALTVQAAAKDAVSYIDAVVIELMRVRARLAA